MAMETKNLGLYLEDNSGTKFKEWRDKMNGPTGSNMEKLDDAVASKQDKLTGTRGQVVGFDENGNAVPQVAPDTGVTTFNGRTGAVTPQTGDYTAEQVGAISQLPLSYNENNATDESKFEAWLDAVLQGMGKNTLKYVKFSVHPVISGVMFAGYLYKHERGDYASLWSMSYSSEYCTKVKCNGTWETYQKIPFNPSESLEQINIPNTVEDVDASTIEKIQAIYEGMPDRSLKWCSLRMSKASQSIGTGGVFTINICKSDNKYGHVQLTGYAQVGSPMRFCSLVKFNGVWSTGWTDLNAIPYATVAPKALGTAAVGTSTRVAREDHVHPLPSASAIGAAPATHQHDSGVVGALCIGENASTDIYGITLGFKAESNGSYSTAIGFKAKSNGNGDSIAIGAEAMVTGSYSIAIGSRAKSNGSVYGIAIGVEAMATGLDSIAIGSMAESSDSGLAIGSEAMVADIGGTALGSYTIANARNSTALGFEAIASNENSIQLGNASSLASLTCLKSLTVTSDERDKTDIQNIGRAVDFLKRVRTFSYVRNDRELYNKTNEELSEEEREIAKKYGFVPYDKESHSAGTLKRTRRRVGVSAQAVQQALIDTFGTADYADIVNDNLHDFPQEDIPEGVESHLGVTYEKFIPFLIKAVQELDARLSDVEALNA